MMDGKVPVFSVLRKGINIKNIVLNCPLPQIDGDDDYAYKILMGRHPDREIVVDHPSISRFHIEIQLLNQKLYVVDLSSVHGTYVLGKKIGPHLPVELCEGDVLKLGASTRVYILRWVPIRDAFELENPLESLLEEEEHRQDDDCVTLVDNFDGLKQSTVPSAPPMPESMSTSSLIPLEDCRQMKESEDLKESSFPICYSPATGESKEIISQVFSPPRLEKGVMSSGLLSRRNRTVGLLRVHTGRSEKIAEEIFNAKIELEKKNSVKGEEHECKVDANDEPDEEDEQSYVSDKENITPAIPSCLKVSSPPSCFDTNLEGKGAKEEEEETIISDKENMTPESSINKRSGSLQKRLQRSRLSVVALSNRKDKELLCGLEDEEASFTEFTVGKGEGSLCRVLFSDSHEIRNDNEGDEDVGGMLQSRKMNMWRRSSTFFVNSLKGSEKENIAECSARNEEKYLCRFLFPDEENSCADRNVKLKEAGGPDDEDDDGLFLSDKENMTPGAPLSSKLRKGDQKLWKSSETVTVDSTTENRTETCHPHNDDSTQEMFWREYDVKLQNLDFDEGTSDLPDEIYTSDKENMTPQISAAKAKEPLSENHKRIEMKIIGRTIERREPFQALLEDSCTESPLSEAKVPDSENSLSSEMKSTKRRTERVPFQCLQENSISSSKSSPLSEVKKSNSSHLNYERSGTSKRRVERVPFQPLVENSISNSLSSPCFDVASPYACSGHSKSKQPLTKEHDTRKQKDIENVLRRKERIPSQQSLLEVCTDKIISSCGELDDSAIHSINEAVRVVDDRKKKWNIVADISCFTNEESWKSLQLLEGIRGTHLVVPRLVIRELDHLKRQENIFRKGTKSSSVLQWIEKCMVQTSWWIEVQRSGEMMPIAPTPPVSPSTELNERNDVTFSFHGSLAEIVSPTAEDHILDCAMLFKRIKYDEQFVLLTNSVSLKIKAMAEGLLCETASAFRESLVSPYSDRFLWADNCPRGSTWSCSDEVELIKRRYQHCPTLRRSVRAAEGAKGLKLILLHNANYVQLNSAR